MARRIIKELNDSAQKEVLRVLLDEIIGIKTIADLDKFLDKYITMDQKNLLIRRLAVINLINSGKKYREISELMEISDNTISNIKDIMAGRGYGRNPKRKRIYSEYKNYKKKKTKKIFPKYKGAESII